MDQAIAGGWGRGVIGMADRASPRKVDLFGLFTALVVLLVLALIAFPIGRMILRAFSVDGAPSLAIVRDVLSQTWLPDVALNTVTVGGDDHSGTYGMVPVQCPLPHPDAVSLSSPHRS